MQLETPRQEEEESGRDGTGRVLISCPAARRRLSHPRRLPLPFSQFHPFLFVVIRWALALGLFQCLPNWIKFSSSFLLFPREYSAAAPFITHPPDFKGNSFGIIRHRRVVHHHRDSFSLFSSSRTKSLLFPTGGREGGKHFGSRRERNNSRTESSQPATFPSIHPSGPVVWPKDICCALVVVETGTKESTLDDAAGWMDG